MQYDTWTTRKRLQTRLLTSLNPAPSAPKNPLISLAAAKTYLRLTNVLNDDIVNGLIYAATTKVEAELNYQVTKTEYISNASRGDIDVLLQGYPVVSIDEVSYIPAVGDSPIVVNPTDYYLDRQFFGDVLRWNTEPFTCIDGLDYPLEIKYTAGYEGDVNLNAIPRQVYQAFDMIVSNWYMKSEDGAKTGFTQVLPTSAELLLSQVARHNF